MHNNGEKINVNNISVVYPGGIKALDGFDRVIPLVETIEAMYSCGRMLPQELRCTGRGGLISN